VRAYAEPEVRIGLKWAGLTLDEVYGDFDGSAYGSDSDRLILVGRKVVRR
jgi:hypothetical protein